VGHCLGQAEVILGNESSDLLTPRVSACVDPYLLVPQPQLTIRFPVLIHYVNPCGELDRCGGWGRCGRVVVVVVSGGGGRAFLVGGGTEGVGSRGGWGELMPKVLVAQGCDSLLVLEVACQVLVIVVCFDHLVLE
jgi:hypothetical protein